MAGERTLKITIVGDAKSAQGALRAVEVSAEQAESKLGRFRDGLGKLGAIATGVLAGGALLQAPALLSNMAQSAADDAASMGRLEQAITNAGGAFAPYAARVDEAIKQGQALAFTDDDVRNALSLLTAETGDVDEAFRRLTLAQDLARGTGMDLGTASKLLGKVTDENVRVLARYGIVVQQGASAQDLMNAVDQKFGGQAAKFASSDAGKWAKLKDQLSEAQEALGYKVLPAMAALVDLVTSRVVPTLNLLIDNIGKLTPVLAGIAAAILVAVVPSFWAWATSAAAAATATIAALLPVLVPLAAIGAAVGVLVAAWENNWFGIRDTVSSVVGVVSGVLGALWSALQGQASALLPQFAALWSSLQPVFVSLVAPLQAIVAQVLGIGGAITGNAALMQQFAALWQQLQLLWVQLQPVVTLLAQIIGAVLVAALGLLLAQLGGLVGMLAGLLPGAIQAFTGALQVVTGIVQLVVGAIQLGIAAITGLVTGDWANANAQMTAITESMRSAVIGIWNGLKNVVIGLVSALVGGVLGLVDGFGNTLFGYFGAIYTRLTGQTAVSWQQVKDGIGGALAAIWQRIQDVWNAVVAFLGGVLTGLVSFITDRMTGIQTVFSTIWSAIQSVVTALANSMVGQIIAAIVNLGRTILDEIGKTADLLGVIWDRLVARATERWDTLRDNLERVVSNIRDAITARIEALRDALSGIWDTVSSRASDVWTSISTTVGTLVGQLRSAIEGPLTAVRDTLSGIWDSISSKATGAWDAIKTAISNGGAAMLTALRWPFDQLASVADGIMRGAGNALLGPLRGAGGSISRFGNGVRDVINWIAEKLGLGAPIGGGAPGVPVPELATGTRDWSGGVALVGERGPELVYLPRHAAVLPAHETRQALAGEVPGFAGGLNPSGIWDWLKKGAQAALDAAIAALGLVGPALPGALTGAGSTIFATIKDWMLNFVKGLFGKASPISPDAVDRMIRFAESKVGLPYLWGGGHGAQPDMVGPYDCSGFVRAVLAAGGIVTPSWVVTDFYNWMRGGRTGIVDIGTNDATNPDPTIQHMGIGLAGQWYETGGRAGGTGRTADYFSEIGHPPDLDKAKGTSDAAALTWLNIVTGRIRGQFGGIASVPPLATLLDFFATNPRLFTLRNLERIAAVLPRGPIALASGGIVTQPTVALIGEDGPEAVVPLGRRGARAGLRTYNVTVNNTVGMDERQLVNWLRRLELVYG